MPDFFALCQRLAALLTEKRAAYGANMETAPQILRLLYPDGISPAQVDDALIVVRVLDKLSRIAHGARGAAGEDAWLDIAGYGICALARGLGRCGDSRGHGDWWFCREWENGELVGDVCGRCGRPMTECPPETREPDVIGTTGRNVGTWTEVSTDSAAEPEGAPC